MCGHPIDVERDADYINLYHIFERIPESTNFRMLRKQVGPSRWHIFLLPTAEFALMRKLRGGTSGSSGPVTGRS